MKVIAYECPNGNCPQVIDPQDGSEDVLVQGFQSTLDAPEGENIVRTPRKLIVEAAARLSGTPSGSAIAPLASGAVEDFGALFDRFTTTAFRLETLQAYNVEEDVDAIAAWRAGRARPEFSVRTSPWAARLATSTIEGKTWRRVRVVDLPLSDYVRWEMAAYIESAVLGEEIRILVRSGEFGNLINDFWLFDALESAPYAVAQRYDVSGRPGNHEVVTDPGVIATRYTAVAQRAWDAATPLNEWLAQPDVAARRSA
jgi:hypothetical protein